MRSHRMSGDTLPSYHNHPLPANRFFRTRRIMFVEDTFGHFALNDLPHLPTTQQNGRIFDVVDRRWLIVSRWMLDLIDRLIIHWSLTLAADSIKDAESGCRQAAMRRTIVVLHCQCCYYDRVMSGMIHAHGQAGVLLYINAHRWLCKCIFGIWESFIWCIWKLAPSTSIQLSFRSITPKLIR